MPTGIPTIGRGLELERLSRLLTMPVAYPVTPPKPPAPKRPPKPISIWQVPKGQSCCIDCHRKIGAMTRKSAGQSTVKEPDYCAWCARPRSEEACAKVEEIIRSIKWSTTDESIDFQSDRQDDPL